MYRLCAFVDDGYGLSNLNKFGLYLCVYKLLNGVELKGQCYN